MIEFETLPAYCIYCHVQGHNAKTCKWEAKKWEANQKVRKENGKADRVWVRLEKIVDQPVVGFQEGETS